MKKIPPVEIVFFVFVLILTIIQTIVLISWIYRGYIMRLSKYTRNIEMISKTNMNSIDSPTINSSNKIDMISTPKSQPSSPVKRRHKISLVLITLTTLSILLSTLYIYFFTIFASLQVFILEYDTPQNKLRLLYGFPLLYFGRTFLYTYYLNRLYTTFKDSIYKISKLKYSILIGFVFIPVYGSLIFFVYANIVRIETNRWNESRGVLYTYISLVTPVTLDVTYNGLLFYMFISRLRMVIKLGDADQQHSSNKFDNLIRKLTSLVVISIIPQIMTMITYIINGGIGSIVIYIDTITSSLCLILSFSMYDREYKKYCFCFIKK